MERETDKLWTGPFGDQYTERNQPDLDKNKSFFLRALARCREIESVVEFGANLGANLMAINRLNQDIDLIGIEINSTAHAMLLNNLKNRVGGAMWAAIHNSFLNERFDNEFDLAFTKGVLIHIHPDDLPDAYDRLYQASKRYILIAEYFSPEPREITYRGNHGVLWTRDFGGEMMDAHPDLKLLDVGFSYKRTTGQDNIVHWLFEKAGK